MLESYEGDIVAIYLHQTKKPTHSVPLHLCKDGEKQGIDYHCSHARQICWKVFEKFGQTVARSFCFDCETDPVYSFCQ